MIVHPPLCRGRSPRKRVPPHFSEGSGGAELSRTSIQPPPPAEDGGGTRLRGERPLHLGDFSASPLFLFLFRISRRVHMAVGHPALESDSPQRQSRPHRHHATIDITIGPGRLRAVEGVAKPRPRRG